MKWKFMAGTVAGMLKLFGVDRLPVNAETKKMELTPEQEAIAMQAMGEKYEDVRNTINAELKEMAEHNFDLMAVEEELKAARAFLAAKADEESKTGIPVANPEKLSNAQTVQQITALLKIRDQQVEAMTKESVGDTGKVIALNGKQMRQHNSTHLNASGFEYDAFEGRSWNEKAAGISMGSSDFNTKVDIPLLQGDIEHFVRKNPTSLESIFNDFETLPSDWAKLTGIIDRVISGLIAPSEITQGNNDGWNPKGELLIDTEEGRVYDKKIDITLTGEKLKQIEKSWLTFLNGSDGSHPWKTTFVGFLLGEYIKQVALDSRIAQVNGIYVKNPKTITGKNINSQNGLRAMWYYYRDVVKQYTPFDLGEPTESNIVDYIRQMIESIPQKDRNQPGYEIQLSYDLLKQYQERAGQLYTLQFASDLGKTKYDGNSPLNYPNYKFQPLIDQNNTNFIGITFSKNVENLQFLESEKGQFTMTHEKRDTHMFADFKEGIRFIQVGRKLEAGDPKEFEYQRLYSNTSPVFSSDTRVPYFDKGTSIVNLKYPEFFPNIEIVQNDFSQNITQITGVVPGQIVTITGNASMAAARTVVNNANLLLTSAFPLNTGGTLTMVVQSDLKLKELVRTNAPSTAPTTSKNFSTGVIDAKTGSVFNFTGGVTTAVTSIVNGAENKTITIYGTDTAGVDVTMSTVGNIKLASAATLLQAVNYVELILIGGVWYETKRSV
jgi:hypothetical protein